MGIMRGPTGNLIQNFIARLARTLVTPFGEFEKGTEFYFTRIWCPEERLFFIFDSHFYELEWSDLAFDCDGQSHVSAH